MNKLLLYFNFIIYPLNLLLGLLYFQKYKYILKINSILENFGFKELFDSLFIITTILCFLLLFISLVDTIILLRKKTINYRLYLYWIVIVPWLINFLRVFYDVLVWSSFYR
jgi:hypothetical protein